VGSLAGSYLAVLLLIPTIGTDRTFVTFSVCLLLVSIVGLVQERGKALASGARHGGALIGAYVAALIIIVALAALPRSVIRAQPYGELLYESESAYNYIQVVKNGTRTDLILNEGAAVHSIYDPTTLLTRGPWDYFLVAPFFQPGTREADVDSLLLLGSAAGTTARQYTAVFGPVPIDGVEIDPKIIEAGRRYFAMTMPNLNAIPQDARYYLRNTPKKYRIVAVDAYRQPYIPFHLTTREFFTEVKDHLEPGGVAAINTGRTESDYRLVNVLAGTMKSVYPNVFVINIPTSINSIVVGTTEPSTLAEFRANLARIQQPVLRQVADVAAVNVCEYIPPAPTGGPAVGAADEHCPFADALGRSVFTDDLAPVEQVIDQIILGYIQANA
jgi:predicted membrane-bound spermidine synthase